MWAEVISADMFATRFGDGGAGDARRPPHAPRSRADGSDTTPSVTRS